MMMERFERTSNPLPKRVPKEILESIPSVKFELQSEKRDCEYVCSICLEEFMEDHLTKQLPACNHLFHQDCIDCWLERR